MIKETNLKEAIVFGEENGYIFAVYEKKADGNYHKIADDTDDIDFELRILLEVNQSFVDYKEFETSDKKYCFRLHNNYNIPDIIPAIVR